MKKLFSLLLCLCLLAALGGSALALVEPSDSFYVTDAANVLSESTEQDIINYNGALEYQCGGAQIVVVTVDYLDGMKSDAYAYQLFNDWGVGSAEKNNGMLLLLAVKENKAWLAYGLGLSERLSTRKVDDLLDNYFWTDFDKGNYDAAVGKLFKALLKWYDGVYGSSVASAGDVSVSPSYGGGAVPVQQSGGSYRGYSSVLRVVLFLLIILALTGGGRRSGLGRILPWLFLFNNRSGFARRGNWNDWPPRGGGFGGGMGRGGGGFGGFGGGFGGGSGHGGGGFSGGGGGRR